MSEAKEKARSKPTVGQTDVKAFVGFLPFYTNTFDRVFISVVILIGIHLLWLRFVEPRPIELATLFSFLIGFFVVRYG